MADAGQLPLEDFRKLVSVAADGYLLTDNSGRILEVDDGYCRLTGYSREELLGTTIADIEAVKERGGNDSRTGTILSSSSDRLESRHRRKDGTLVPLEIRFVKSVKSDLIHAFFRDLTEESGYREILDARQRLFEYSVDHSLDDLLRETIDEAQALTGSCVGFYHFFAEDREELLMQAWSTTTTASFCKAEEVSGHYPIAMAGVWADCIRERRPVIHNEIGSLPNLRGMPEGHAEVIRELVVPIVHKGNIVAVLGVGNKPCDYTQEDVKAASLLGELSWLIVMYKQKEEELYENAARFESLVQAGADVVYRLNADCTAMTVISSRSFIPESTEPRPILLERYIPEEDQAGVLAAIDRAVRSRAPYEMEHRVLRPDGTIGWIFSRAVPVMNGNNEILEWFGMANDITEHKQTELRQAFLMKLSDALRPLTDSNEIQETAACILAGQLGATRAFYFTEERDEQSGGYIHVITGNCYRQPNMASVVGRHHLPAANQNLYSGLAKGENLVVADVNGLPESCHAYVESYLQLGIQSFIAVPLIKGGEYIAAIVVNDSVPRQWEPYEIAMVEDAAERTWSAVERARTEEALRMSEDKYRTLFEKTNVAFMLCEAVLDDDGKMTDYRLLDANPAFEKLYGLPRVEFIGLLRSGMNMPPDQQLMGHVPDLLRSGEPLQCESRSATSGQWHSMNVFPLGHDRFAILSSNITDRKKIEEELKKSNETLKENAAAVERSFEQIQKISFDLIWAEERERERIASELHDQVGQSLLLAQMKLGALAEEVYGPMAGSLEEARELVKQCITDIRSLTFKMRPPLLETAGLDMTFRWLCSTIGDDFGCTVDYNAGEVPANIPPELRSPLYQSVRELLINAAKHARADKVSLAVNSENGALTISVSDDGIGFNFAKSRLKIAAGSSYGLFNVQQRIERLKGTLTIESEPGRGTVATIRIAVS